MAPVAQVLDGLDPCRGAVLVVDLQNDFCDPHGAMAESGVEVSSAHEVLGRLGAFLEAARHSGAIVVFVTLAAETGPLTLGQELVQAATGRPAGRVCREGTWGSELHPTVPVREGDLSISKRRYSAFARTGLELTLRRRDIDHVVVVGTTANVCVQATAMDAYLRDFGVVVARDLVGFTRSETADAALANLAGYYGVVCTASDIMASWRRREMSGSASSPLGVEPDARRPGPGSRGTRAHPAAGVIVPPENPSVEPEMSALLGGAVRMYTARLPVLSGGLSERLAGYNECLPDALRSFGRLALTAVLVACTGSSYRLGCRGDKGLREALTHQRGRPVATATAAIRKALSALGDPPVTIVSPYPQWLTEQAVAFYRESSVEVVGVCSIESGDGGIYGLSPEAVVAEALRGDLDGSAAVLFTGTGMPTLRAIGELGRRGVVALSSNLCGAWWLATEVLGPDAVATDARLHPELRHLAGAAAPLNAEAKPAASAAGAAMG